jgi:hypothetical protein
LVFGAAYYAIMDRFVRRKWPFREPRP